ncbi:MAG TPA: DUF2934 domain-containing protein [Acidobacteriaceae bacterium]|jgi:hypothetical protein|nr:DUF2934 domain-containing protein [Acidobacteriaceae bacterium]
MATKKATGTAEKKATTKTAETTPATSPAKKAPAKAASKKAAAAETKSPTHQEIAQLAHRFWEERGRPHGGHEQDWIRAEKELKG